MKATKVPFDSNKLVSIIVPVHNTENHLRQCLDSLLAQTYSNIEVVCVNNLSSDASLSILREYEQEDMRIKVSDIETAGVSNARNIGFAKAGGDYIIFVDSDDQLAPKAIEILLKVAYAHSSDVVISSIEGRPEIDWVTASGTAASAEFTSSSGNTHNHSSLNTHKEGVLEKNSSSGHQGSTSTEPAISLSAQDIGKLFFEQPGAFPFIHGKLFARDLLNRAAGQRTNQELFNTKYHIAEDTLFLFTALPFAKKITFIPEVTSIYTTVRTDSCTSNHNDSAFARLKVHVNVVYEIFEAWESYGVLKEIRSQLFNWACEFLYSDALAIYFNQKVAFASTWQKLCKRFSIEEVLDNLNWRSFLYYELMLVKGAEKLQKTPVQNRTPKLSIMIIPATQGYSTDSIKSILNQSEWDLEIYIWINSDAAARNDLYEEFISMDSRVHLVQANSSLEFLMQSTKMCNSELTLISDSDALYDRDFASHMLKQANNCRQSNASMLVCSTNYDTNIGDLSLSNNKILYPNNAKERLLSFSGTYLANKILKSAFLHQELLTIAEIAEIAEAKNAKNTRSSTDEKSSKQKLESLKALRILCSLCLLHAHSIVCTKDKLLFIPNIYTKNQISTKLKVEAAGLASSDICYFYKDDPRYSSILHLLFIAYYKDCHDSMRNCRSEEEFYILSHLFKKGACSVFNKLYQNPANYLSANDFEYTKLCVDLSDCNECDLGKTNTQLQATYLQLVKLAQLDAKANVDQLISLEHELLLKSEEIDRTNAIIDRFNTEVYELQAIVENLHEKVAELHGELDHVYNSKRYKIGNTAMRIPDMLRKPKK